ncbi:MAG: chemotaxis-specific protein-glutamate methyltransferase CheB [Candidatus Hodarchaeales archaeon]|jgi:two-component system chemotaxis response regulator CheB
MNKRKIMIVDDSAVFRVYLSRVIENSNQPLEVVTTASNGVNCLHKLAVPRYKPDVVLLDVMMPEMDGIETVDHIMERFPTPVIIVSSMTQRDVKRLLSNKGMSIFESGTVEFVRKPDASDPDAVRRFERELISKIRSLSPINLQKVFQGFDMKSFMSEEVVIPRKIRPTSVGHRNKVIIIGASTGGTRAISLILSKFPSKAPPLVIVQHMPEMMTNQWAERLDYLYKHLRITLARDGEQLKPNHVYIAPGGKHLVISEGRRIKLVEGERVNYVIPAIDVTFISAAKTYRQNVLAIVLTGMGKDGTEGAKKIKNMGGRVYTEDESTCVVFSMPRHVIEAKASDKIIPLHNMPVEIRTSTWI